MRYLNKFVSHIESSTETAEVQSIMNHGLAVVWSPDSLILKRIMRHDFNDRNQKLIFQTMNNEMLIIYNVHMPRRFVRKIGEAYDFLFERLFRDATRYPETKMIVAGDFNHQFTLRSDYTKRFEDLGFSVVSHGNEPTTPVSEKGYAGRNIDYIWVRNLKERSSRLRVDVGGIMGLDEKKIRDVVDHYPIACEVYV